MKVLYGYITKHRRENNETILNRLLPFNYLLVVHADSKYQITGKVEEKRKIGNLFTITMNGNVFVVSEERFENIEIGDDIEL